MRYYEIESLCRLKRDISFKESFFTISRFISFSMFLQESLKDLHYKNRLKYYTFSSFIKEDNSIEKDSIYKKDLIYKFSIRSLDKEFTENLNLALVKNIHNPNFIITKTFIKTKEYQRVNEIYSLTPVISTLDNGKFWTLKSSGDILLLIKLLHNNLEKKYNSFYNKNINSNENFIETIEIKNKKPQTIEIIKNNKKIRLFGNKFKIIPKSDEISQKLAFVALGAGLGEKGSFGGGFCVGKG